MDLVRATMSVIFNACTIYEQHAVELSHQACADLDLLQCAKETRALPDPRAAVGSRELLRLTSPVLPVQLSKRSAKGRATISS